jgi:hypothetical protein
MFTDNGNAYFYCRHVALLLFCAFNMKFVIISCKLLFFVETCKHCHTSEYYIIECSTPALLNTINIIKFPALITFFILKWTELIVAVSYPTCILLVLLLPILHFKYNLQMRYT